VLVGGVRLECCSRRVRVCVSLSGVLFSVGVCVCDLLIFVHLALLPCPVRRRGHRAYMLNMYSRIPVTQPHEYE